MVKILFDTSVLIAAFIANHPQHQSCQLWVQSVKDKTVNGIIGTHTLAETYSVLTRLPINPPISAKLAKRLIQENLNDFTIVSLNDKDYLEVIEKMVNLNLIGGAIYDAIIERAALKISADKILTLNPNHFTRLQEKIKFKNRSSSIPVDGYLSKK